MGKPPVARLIPFSELGDQAAIRLRAVPTDHQSVPRAVRMLETSGPTLLPLPSARAVCVLLTRLRVLFVDLRIICRSACC